MIHKWLKPKDCPFCGKIIYDFDRNNRPVRLNENGMLFWAKFNDGTKAQFSICRDCFPSLTHEKLSELMEHQKYTWGMELIHTSLSIAETYKQLSWFVNHAIFLEIVNWNEFETGL